MTPNVDRTKELSCPFYSQWIEGWIEGDGSAKTITIHIANDRNVSPESDGYYNDNEVAAEYIGPSENGDYLAQIVRTWGEILGTPADLASDEAETWGLGADNAQKIVINVAPGCSGPFKVRVGFAKYFSASPETLFFCPKLDIA